MVVYPEGPRLVVAASDYSTGVLAVAPLAALSAIEALPIHPDAMVRSPEGPSDYVVNRGSGNIQKVSKRESRNIIQHSIGRTTNPQDILPLDANTAYVTRFTGTKLLKIRLSDLEPISEPVDFGKYAFRTGGTPQMTLMAEANGLVFVQLQRLKTAVEPSDKSYVIAVDPGTDTIAGEIKLERTNPVTDFKTGPDGLLYVGEAGRTGMISELDGGIERIDPKGVASRGLVVEETQLGGDIVDFEILDTARGVAIVSPPKSGKTRLVTFSLSSGETAREVFETPGYTLQQLALDRDRGELYVADREGKAPGIRVLDAGTLLEKHRIKMVLPPYQMVLSPGR
jgi:hypothetical protein